jgi:hypothetical protein
MYIHIHNKEDGAALKDLTSRILGKCNSIITNPSYIATNYIYTSLEQ